MGKTGKELQECKLGEEYMYGNSTSSPAEKTLGFFRCSRGQAGEDSEQLHEGLGRKVGSNLRKGFTTGDGHLSEENNN